MILALIVFLQVPLISSSADLASRGNLTIIGAATRPHAPPEDSAQELTRSTRRQDPSCASTRRHTPPRAVTRQVPLADVITATSSADITRQSAYVIVDQDVDQIVDQR